MSLSPARLVSGRGNALILVPAARNDASRAPSLLLRGQSLRGMFPATYFEPGLGSSGYRSGGWRGWTEEYPVDCGYKV